MPSALCSADALELLGQSDARANFCAFTNLSLLKENHNDYDKSPGDAVS